MEQPYSREILSKKVISISSGSKDIRDKFARMGWLSAEGVQALARDAVQYAPDKLDQPIPLPGERYLTVFLHTHKELTLAKPTVPDIDLKLAA